MKPLLTLSLFLAGVCCFAQNSFKEELIVNGVFYKAKRTSTSHVCYVQQSDFHISETADSVYMDVMTENQWKAKVKDINRQGAVYREGIYFISGQQQVFVSDSPDPDSGHLIIVSLFNYKN